MTNAVSKRLCFVVGPIGAAGSEARIHADWLLNGIILPTIAKVDDVEVKRADHDTRPGLIDVQMINDLIHADLVIADLSFLNPNAFYEIGIRHTVRKPIIHMQLAHQEPPFDVGAFRLVKFKLTEYSDLENARNTLKDFVAQALSPDHIVDNPVTRASANLQLQETATPKERVLMQEMEDLKREQRDLRDAFARATAESVIERSRARAVLDLVQEVRSASLNRNSNGMAAPAADVNALSVTGMTPNFSHSLNPLMAGITAGSKISDAFVPGAGWAAHPTPNAGNALTGDLPKKERT